MKKLKYLLLLIPFLFIPKVNADIIQSNRGFYYMTNSSGSFVRQNYVTGNSSLTLPNNSRISAWWIDFNASNFNLISGQTYTAYLYFSINNTSYAWVENGTNLFFGVNCVVAPDAGQSCTNYLKSYTNASIVSNMIMIEFDFIAPNLSDNDIVYIALDNHNSNNYALAYSSNNSVTIAFNKLSYDLSSGGISAGEQIIIDGQKNMTQEQKKTNQKLDEVNDNLTDDDTSGAQDSAGGFFNDFTTDTHGLTAVITAPLSLISIITSASCSPLVIPLPYIDKDLTLPCMGTIYSSYFGSFLSIYQMITFGIIAYWVLVRIFNLVKDFKNPDHDEIEVLDL